MKMKKGLQSKTSIYLGISIILIVGNVLYNSYVFNETYKMSTWWVLLYSILIGYIVDNISEERYMLLIIFVVVSFWIFIMPVYSPIDEGNWYSIIDYICKNGKMPLISQTANTADILQNICRPLYNTSNMQMYEVVHPPLYFYTMVLITGWIANSYVRFWACRYIGGIILLLVVKCSFKIFSLLQSNNVIEDEERNILKKCIFIFALLPGVLTRFGTITNESLAVLFVCLFMYGIIKYIFDDDSIKNLVILNLIILAAIMTKTTTAFVFVILLITLLYKKQYKRILISFFIIGVGSLPWLRYNFINYHSFTAMQQHVSIVHPLVNPGGRNIDVFEGVFNLFNNFFYPQEGYNGNGIVVSLIYGLSTVFMILCIALMYKYIKTMCLYIWNCKSRYVYSDTEKKLFLKVICVLWVLGNILILVIGSITANLSLFVGRYLYLSVIPLIILIGTEIKCITNRVKKLCIRIVLIMVVILDVYSAYGYGVSDGIDNISGCMVKTKSIDIKNVQMSDATEEDGYFIFGNNDPQIVIDSNIRQIKGVEIEFNLLETDKKEFQFYYMKEGMDGFDENESQKINYNHTTHSVRITYKNMQGIVRVDPPDNVKIKIDKIKVYY